MGRSRKNKKKNGKNRQEDVSENQKEISNGEPVNIKNCTCQTETTTTQIPMNKVLEETKEIIDDPCLKERCEFTLALYTRLIELSPHSEVLYCSRMKCFMMIDQYESALADAKKSVEVNSKFMEVYEYFIKITMALGDFIEVEVVLAKLSEVDPTNKLLDTQRKRLSRVHQYINQFDRNFDKKKYTFALVIINKILRICTHCILYQIKKGECLIMLGEYKEAEFLASAILDRDKINVDAKYILAFSLYHSDTEKAVEELGKILHLDPEHRKSLKLHEKVKIFIEKKRAGNEAFQQKNFESAHKIYVEALEIDPDNRGMRKRLFYNMAQATYKIGKIRDAIEECTRALEIDPNYVKALRVRGQYSMELKNYDEAMNDLSKAHRLDPSDDCQKLLNEAKKLRKRMENDYHSILGVEKYAPTICLDYAFQEKAKEMDSIRFSGAPGSLKEAERNFKKVTRAWMALRVKSHLYDKKKIKSNELYTYYEDSIGNIHRVMRG